MWVRLGNIISLQNGFAFKSTDYTSHGVKLIRNVNISHGFVDHKDIAYYPDSERTKFEAFELLQGDILISLDRPIISTGLKIAILGEQDVPSLLVQRVGRVRSAVLKVKPSFLFNWFNSSLFINRIAPGRSNGVPHISTKEVEMLLFPLPPLAEQYRIVAKIDRLMARCDELGKLRSDRTQKRITIHTAAINRLLTAKEKSDFDNSWRFITQHFGELYSVKENVAELRKAILQLAVMGKLVPQDPNDEPASELLKAIEAEKHQLMKGRKGQKLLSETALLTSPPA